MTFWYDNPHNLPIGERVWQTTVGAVVMKAPEDAHYAGIITEMNNEEVGVVYMSEVPYGVMLTYDEQTD